VLIAKIGAPRARRLPMERGADKRQNEARSDQEQKRQPGIGLPFGQRVIERLNYRDLAEGRSEAAHRGEHILA
jgi:hypothetical protein